MKEEYISRKATCKYCGKPIVRIVSPVWYHTGGGMPEKVTSICGNNGIFRIADPVPKGVFVPIDEENYK